MLLKVDGLIVDCDTKSSISRLRKLREDLCKKQSDWKKAFKIKDAIVEELKNLKTIAEDSTSDKKEIVAKIDSLLILIDPERELESEDCGG